MCVCALYVIICHDSPFCFSHEPIAGPWSPRVATCAVAFYGKEDAAVCRAQEMMEMGLETGWIPFWGGILTNIAFVW